MRKPTNIRWEADDELPKVDGCEGLVNSDFYYMLFDYNGYEVTAVVSFTLRCNSEIDNYNLGAFDYSTDTLVELFELKEMYINDGEEFKVDLKEFKNIENELGIDLQIQY